MNGILVVNKPCNCTSRDVVNEVSKIFKTKKIGHTGTLDPIATGVLVLTIGTATKLSEILTSEYKEYVASVILGIKTDTLDITGKVLKEENIYIKEEEIKNKIQNMKGTYMQEVPIYSAVKIKGKKLYEYARNNEEVLLPKREVTIKEISLLDDIKYKEGKIYFDVKCLVSKGTYIRSLINDLALSLNTIGTMSNLKRTKQGQFDIKNSYSLEEIKEGKFKLISIESALSKYKQVVVQNESEILNGKILENVYNEPILFKNKKNELLALYKIYEKDNTKIKPWKMLKKDF